MSRLQIAAFVVMAVAGVCIVLHENPLIKEVVRSDARIFAGIRPKPITQEQRDAARASAQRAKSVERETLIHRRVVRFPEGEMAKARRSIDMETAWNGTLWGHISSPAILSATTITGLNCSAQLHCGYSGEVAISGGVVSWIGDDPPEAYQAAILAFYNGAPDGEGFYYVWVFTATANTNTDEVYYVNGTWEETPGLPWPLSGTWVGETEWSADVSLSLTNAYAKGERTPDMLTTRQPMDFTDFSSSDSWFVDEDSEVTCTIHTSDDQTASATCAMTETGEADITLNPWASTWSFTLNSYPDASTVYAKISDWSFADVAVDLTNLDLYYSASEQSSTRAPDQTNSATKHWSRYSADADSEIVRVGQSGGGAATWREGTGTTGRSHTLTLWGPVAGTIKEVSGAHEDGTAYPGTTPQYTSNVFIDWEYVDSAWKYYLEKWTGDFSYAHQHKSWEFEHEWRRLLSSTAVEIYQTDEWREANEEDVGGSATSQNDQQLGVCVPWIDATDWTSEPWTENLLSVAHAASVSINDPPGETRESLWVGSGGVTVNPADNDEWSVANGSSAPKVGRSLLTRKWLRLDRLSGGYNEGDEYYQDWPIIDKANLAIGKTLDDPAWHDSGAGGIDVEDVTHWADYAYLALNITAPVNGTVTLAVSYSVAEISDPCYTCAGSRWDEFEYTRTYHTATYSVDVTSGTHAYLIDLCLPSQQFIPSYAYRIATVDSLQFSLPANSSGSPQVWTLNSLNLAHDTGEGVRSEPTYHVWFKYKRAWDWLNTDWNGISAIVDGKDALQLDYGYDSSYGKTRHEHGMLYVQRSEHCPGSSSTTRLDSLKSIARLEDEINYQEGWTATDNLTVDSSANKDADDNRLAAALYWFDIRQNRHWSFSSSQDLDGAVCVGTFGLLAGIEQHWYAYNVPRGRGHGIITSTDGTQRQRSVTDAARLYSLADGGSSWQFVESLDTDEHGRFWTSPLLENGYSYQLESEGSIWTIANREYTTVSPQLDQYTPIHPHMADGYITDVHLWFVSDGSIYHKRKPTAAMVFQAPVSITSGYYPCGDVLPSGELLMAYQTPASQIAFKRSLNAGVTWGDTGVSVNGKYPILQNMNGIQYLVSYYSGIGQVIRRSQTRFSTLLTYNGATSALISAETNAERVAFIKIDGDGNAMACAVPSGNAIRMYRSVNDGETWVQTI